jgi:hypothetical protein
MTHKNANIKTFVGFLNHMRKRFQGKNAVNYEKFIELSQREIKDFVDNLYSADKIHNRVKPDLIEFLNMTMNVRKPKTGLAQQIVKDLDIGGKK